MPPRKKRKHYLHPTLRRQYERQKEDAEKALEAAPKSEFHTVRTIDKGLLRKTIKKADKVLDARRAPKLRGANKNKAWKRYKELKAELRDELMREKNMHPTKTIEGGRIVADMEEARRQARKQIERIESGQDEKIKEFRDLARVLEPDDPFIGDVEVLRRR